MSVSSNIKVTLPRFFDRIARNDATGGVAMLICTVLALILQNGSYSTSYRHWLELQAGVIFGDFELIKPLLLWINDGLITIFFFSIGLELKIEFVKGHLADRRNIILPSLAAVGGILFPSLCFIAFNYSDDYAMRGWAIPTATDTAFSVGILLLLGNRVPASLKIFLLSMAIFDDIGAILVIALFYTSDLSGPALVSASMAIACLLLLNYMGVARKLFYLFFGVILWFSIFKSGVHATLAGIITAFCIPMKDSENRLMVEPIFDNLKMWIALMVLPVFTIANAGIDLSRIDITDFFSPVSLGVFTGIFLGKQLGIFLVIVLCFKLKLVKPPSDATLTQMYGVCILTGIGFSMSMFIDSLAYQGSARYNYADSLAILVASLCSGVYGYLFLRFVACKTALIHYRPWLPGPSGYRGSAATANLYVLDKEVVQGASSVAPTAAAVAAANARAAAVEQAAQAATQAAQAAQAAEAAAAAVREAMAKGEDNDEALTQVQVAAAQAAQAAAQAAVSSTKIDDDPDNAELVDAATQALDAAQFATEVAVAAQEEAEKEAEDGESEGDAKTEDVSEAEAGAAGEKSDSTEAEDKSDADVAADKSESNDDKAADGEKNSLESDSEPKSEDEKTEDDKSDQSGDGDNADKSGKSDETEAESSKPESEDEGADSKDKDAESKGESKDESKPKDKDKKESKSEEDDSSFTDTVVDVTAKAASVALGTLSTVVDLAKSKVENLIDNDEDAKKDSEEEYFKHVVQKAQEAVAVNNVPTNESKDDVKDVANDGKSTDESLEDAKELKSDSKSEAGSESDQALVSKDSFDTPADLDQMNIATSEVAEESKGKKPDDVDTPVDDDRSDESDSPKGVDSPVDAEGTSSDTSEAPVDADGDVSSDESVKAEAVSKADSEESKQGDTSTAGKEEEPISLNSPEGAGPSEELKHKSEGSTWYKVTRPFRR